MQLHIEEFLQEGRRRRNIQIGDRCFGREGRFVDHGSRNGDHLRQEGVLHAVLGGDHEGRRKRLLCEFVIYESGADGLRTIGQRGAHLQHMLVFRGRNVDAVRDDLVERHALDLKLALDHRLAHQRDGDHRSCVRRNDDVLLRGQPFVVRDDAANRVAADAAHKEYRAVLIRIADDLRLLAEVKIDRCVRNGFSGVVQHENLRLTHEIALPNRDGLRQDADIALVVRDGERDGVFPSFLIDMDDRRLIGHRSVAQIQLIGHNGAVIAGFGGVKQIFHADLLHRITLQNRLRRGAVRDGQNSGIERGCVATGVHRLHAIDILHGLRADVYILAGIFCLSLDRLALGDQLFAGGANDGAIDAVAREIRLLCAGPRDGDFVLRLIKHGGCGSHGRRGQIRDIMLRGACHRIAGEIRDRGADIDCLSVLERGERKLRGISLAESVDIFQLARLAPGLAVRTVFHQNGIQRTIIRRQDADGAVARAERTSLLGIDAHDLRRLRIVFCLRGDRIGERALVAGKVVDSDLVIIGGVLLGRAVKPVHRRNAGCHTDILTVLGIGAVYTVLAEIALRALHPGDLHIAHAAGGHHVGGRGGRRAVHHMLGQRSRGRAVAVVAGGIGRDGAHRDDALRQIRQREGVRQRPSGGNAVKRNGIHVAPGQAVRRDLHREGDHVVIILRRDAQRDLRVVVAGGRQNARDDRRGSVRRRTHRDRLRLRAAVAAHIIAHHAVCVVRVRFKACDVQA